MDGKDGVVQWGLYVKHTDFLACYHSPTHTILIISDCHGIFTVLGSWNNLELILGIWE